MIALLWIIKIIGIILCIALGLILFAVVTILLTTIKYKLNAQKYQQVLADGNVSLWFGIIRAVFNYNDDKFSYSVYILGKKRMSSEEEAQQKTPKENMATPSEVFTKPVEEKSDKEKQEKEKQEKEKQKPEQNETKTINQAKKQAAGQTYKKVETEPTESSYKQTKEERTKEEAREATIRRIKINKEDLKEESKKQESKPPEKLDMDYFKNMSWDRRKHLLKVIVIFIKRVVKWVCPKKSQVNLVIGTGDPALTGQVVGGIAILKGITGLNINGYGNFSETEFSGDCYIEGKLNIGVLISAALKLIFDKEIFKIIKLYLKGMKN